MLAGRRVVLGVTGSIAAYKAAELASQLVQAGAQVDVVMTEAAIRFVTPLTFRSLTGRPVYVEMFDPETEVAEQHVALARQADAVVIAPATASTIARLAQGLASDMVSVVALATRAPILLAPAMDTQMFDHPATQANLALLQQRGIAVVGPSAGRLASGHYGLGRLAEVPEVIGALRWLLGRTKGDLIGRHIVVSAGGTQEPIDPVRFVSNYSSGKMGYALAEAARDRGAEVSLVSAPTALAAPYGVELARVRTAMEMCEAIVEKCQGADALIMAAAVADYQPQAPLEQKLKREETEGLTLSLVRTPDILGSVPGKLVKVGFAAESQELLANAWEKLQRKGLDLIVANDITDPQAGFGADTNRVVILGKDGDEEHLPLLSKYDVAWRVLDRVAELLWRRS